MRITSIQFFNTQFSNIKIKKQNNKIQTKTEPTFAPNYKDFGINFRGRTPEDFYAQEFNVKYMPDTMKRYLAEDSESRKYLPPEQVMSESFRYLEVAENFDDVREFYPAEKEPLFSNLHEASTKGRSGILSDIKLSKELSDTPLLKDGSDNFGMYLLKKIYLEGKTIKEINKDFYEKDLNPEYKGAITQPITYGTTSAYGIRYPKTDFWNSFISTRDEYKKFFVDLPKKTKSDLTKELSETKEKEDKPKKTYVRKYTIKKHQKTQLKDDIKKAKGDAEAIEKAIRKRFSKDDPEASFIVKYLSPIMTIAADRIHLSQEEKEFADIQKSNGKKLENFFAQFWKSKPQLLEHYSTAITDTIELFEETYGEGGFIPINKDFEIVTKDIENQKAIDFVPKEFVELLDYVQTIVPSREKKYAEHEKMQKEWNEHFDWRYGASEIVKEENIVPQDKTLDPMKMLEDEAKKQNAGIYHLRGKNGDDYVITANLDEVLEEYIKKVYCSFPSKFVKLFIEKLRDNPLMTENAKLTFATVNIADELCDERIISNRERKAILNHTLSDMYYSHGAATQAALDTYATFSKEPEKVYRSMMGDNLPDDVYEYNKIMLMQKGKPEVQSKLNELYEKYRKPLSIPEITKIVIAMSDFLRNIDLSFTKTKSSVLCESEGVVSVLYEIKSRLNKKESSRWVKKLLSDIFSNMPYSRTVLDKNVSKKQYRAKCELVAHALVVKMGR